MTQPRIAIFNGFPFHYEMFGFVLEYLTNLNLSFDIFSETRDEMGWIHVYETRFARSFPFQNIKEYNPIKYDYLILLTDDDSLLRWSDGAKIIMFEHSGIRTVRQKPYRRIQLRQFVNRVPFSSPDTWCLPVWNIRQRPKELGVKVVAVGNNCPCNPEELKPWIYDIRAPTFVFINRNPAPTKFDHASWEDYPNVRLLENINADQLLEEVATADWAILLPKNEYQHKTFISAILPIAYGVGVPILMKREWIPAYNMGGMRPLDNTVSLTKPSEQLLAEVIQTRKELLKRRDKILTECLKN